MANDRPSQFYTVPAGKQPRRCDYCRESIYFIRVPKTGGKTAWIPVHCNPEKVPGAKLPTPTEDGSGINHWKSCEGRDAARRDHPRPAPRKEGQAIQREMAVDHKAHTCIFCGCTTGKRCSIPKGELDSIERDVQIGRFSAIGFDQLPNVVSCYFMQFDPPVCSKCKGRRAELPLRMRAGVRDSEVAR